MVDFWVFGFCGNPITKGITTAAGFDDCHDTAHKSADDEEPGHVFAHDDPKYDFVENAEEIAFVSHDCGQNNGQSKGFNDPLGFKDKND
jgi:hypothetical protein